MSHEGTRLAGKVAIVTGGASGIGEAICRLFAAEGATVAIADINALRGAEIARDLANGPGEVTFIRTNVAVDEDVAQAVDAVVERFGRLDIMVNNAGIGGQPVDDAAWWRLFDVDLIGTVWGTRHAVRAMSRSGGGVIVDIGSHAGQHGCRTGPYGAAKAAVHTLMRYTALTHGPDRIRANAVLPGNIYTTIHDVGRQQAIARYVDGDADAFAVDPVGQQRPSVSKEEVLEDFRHRHPMGRLAEVDDIARAVLFLASDDSRVVTGNEFMVTGGILPKRLSDRLAAAGAVRAWPHAPCPPEGTIAVISANAELGDAIAAGLAEPALHIVTAPAAVRTDERGLLGWLQGFEDLAGIVFVLSPDPGGTLQTQGSEEWHRVLGGDVRIPWLLGTRAAQLILPGGCLTFVSDTAGITGAGGSPAFCAAAAALSYFTDGFADELRERQIRVNGVTSELTSRLRGDPALGAPAGAEDIAEAVAYLSRGARAVTGSQIVLETAHP